MPDMERLTITLRSEMAVVVKGAVEGGDYASSSEVVREALRDWKLKRALQLQELAAPKADIDRSLTDMAEQIATRFVRAIEATFEPLREFPLAGPAREQLAPGLRVTIHSSYAIY